MQVATRILAADGTKAGRVQLLVGELVDRPTELQQPARGERRAELRDLVRDDAVEHIDPTVDGLEQVKRRTHAHEIAWAVGRQHSCSDLTRILALVLFLAHGQTTDGETIKG